MYFDVHTHALGKADSIVNAYPDDFAQYIQDFPSDNFSLGIHPMYANNHEECLSLMKKHLVHPQVRLIGEIGLDKRFDDMAVQQSVFEQQMQMASDAQLNVIIHCVRATNEILQIARNFPTVKLIFHGFRGKPQLANQILSAGHFLSFGEKSILVPDNIRITPLNRLFIETDESEIPIEYLYDKVAQIKGISVSELTAKINNNKEDLLRER